MAPLLQWQLLNEAWKEQGAKPEQSSSRREPQSVRKMYEDLASTC